MEFGRVVCVLFVRCFGRLERLACCVTCVYASVGLCLCGVPKARWGRWIVSTKACGTLGIHSYAIVTIDSVEGASSTLNC